MSDANRMRLDYAEESAYGVFETSGFKEVRFTGESLSQVTGTVNSAEIRSDRQIVDHIRTTINTAGDINIELSYGAFDDFLEAALFADTTWGGAVSISAQTDVAVTAVTGTIVSPLMALDSLAVGSWIKVAGFATTGNNGVFKIITNADGNTITVEPKAGMTDESAGPSVTIEQGDSINNGVLQKSYSLQKGYIDETEFSRLSGCVIDTFTFDVPSDNIVTGSFGFLGKIDLSSQTDIDSSPDIAAANEVMAGIEDITTILDGIGTATLNIPSTQFSLSINNNLRQRLQIGTLGPIGIGAGTVDVSGTLQGYFTNATLIDKYLNFTDTELAIVFQDSTGKGYVINCNRVNFDQGNRVAGGVNTDILADLTFSAYREPVASGKTITITRFAA